VARFEAGGTVPPARPGTPRTRSQVEHDAQGGVDSLHLVPRQLPPPTRRDGWDPRPPSARPTLGFAGRPMVTLGRKLAERADIDVGATSRVDKGSRPDCTPRRSAAPPVPGHARHAMPAAETSPRTQRLHVPQGARGIGPVGLVVWPTAREPAKPQLTGLHEFWHGTPSPRGRGPFTFANWSCEVRGRLTAWCRAHARPAPDIGRGSERSARGRRRAAVRPRPEKQVRRRRQDGRRASSRLTNPVRRRDSHAASRVERDLPLRCARAFRPSC
jgi:hypothetical protein